MIALATPVILFAQTSGTTPQPILRMETGMHTASIRRVAVDRAGRWLVTASDDKTARVWDLQTGLLVRILRVPIGPGGEGKLYAVAISPDGNTVAVGGWTHNNDEQAISICLFERESGHLVRRVGSFQHGISSLAFSPNGHFLAAAIQATGGLHIFQTVDWQETYSDTDYAADSYGVDFDGTSRRLVTTSYDGFLRRYERRLVGSGWNLMLKAAAPGGRRPNGVKFSPDGSKIAVGFNDSKAVNVLSAADLRLQFSPDTGSWTRVNNLGQVAWSSDGGSLYANGGNLMSRTLIIRRWSDGGRGPFTDTGAADESIFDLKSLPDGGIVYGAGEPSWGIIDRDGKLTRRVMAAVADYRGLSDKFLLFRNASDVAFAYEDSGKSPGRFSVTSRRLSVGEIIGDERPLLPPRVTGLNVTDWKNTYEPKLDGKKLALNDLEFSRSLAIAPDNSKFLLGTEWNLRLFDKTGNELWKKSAPEVPWDVNIAANGDVAVAAFGDGTIRWYRMTDGEELLALFPHPDKKRWVLWTPSGYYDASPGAEDLIGWHVNNGAEQAADFFPVGQFRDTYYRPDVTARVLTTLDEKVAVAQADASRGVPARLSNQLFRRLPPVVEITSPSDGTGVAGRSIKIAYNIRTRSAEAVTAIKVSVNGRPTGVTPSLKSGAGEVTVELPQNDAEISVIADNRFAPSVPATVRVKWVGEKPKGVEVIKLRSQTIVKPKLYVLAIGVSLYKLKKLTLGYAAKDSKDFVAAMQKQKGIFYRDTEVRALSDAEATRDNIVDGLEWISTVTKPEDTAMIYISGHGLNDKLNRYYFLPYNYDPEHLASTGVVFTDIKNAVEVIAGNVLFFIDTCHAGNAVGASVDINGLVNGLSRPENGVVVFAASMANQTSLESAAWNNGAFTKALIEGLAGKADFSNDGEITVNSLELYLGKRVPELTNNQQTPAIAKPKTVPDFTVAVTR